MKWSKLGLIITTFAVAVLVVLYFLKTRVTPPKDLEFTNQHLICLQQDVAKMKRGMDITTADSLFDVTLNAARLFQNEGFVSPDDADQIVKQIADGYVPHFVEKYSKFFAGIQWDSRQMQKLRERAKLLLELKSQIDETTLLDDALRVKVDSVNIILNLYDEANRHSKRTKFESLAKSESVIKQAKKYAAIEPLNNCTSLVRKLNSMGKDLENAHYRYVEALVSGLHEYQYIDKNEYMNTRVPKVYSAIKEYKEGARRVYGTSHSMEAFEKNASEAYKNAEEYYNKPKSW